MEPPRCYATVIKATMDAKVEKNLCECKKEVVKRSIG